MSDANATEKSICVQFYQQEYFENNLFIQIQGIVTTVIQTTKCI